MMIPGNKVSLAENNRHVDIKKLQLGDSLVQFFAIFTPVKQLAQIMPHLSPYDFVKQTHARYQQELAQSSSTIAQALTYPDIEQNRKENKISAMLSIEEGAILDGKIERLDELYAMGVRMSSLTWNYENCLAYPNSKDKMVMQRGLKPFGIEAVRRMQQLGMLIDVSHLSDGGFWDVIAESQPCKAGSQPVVASHSNARALSPHTRNLTDAMLKAIADTGGVVGLNFGLDFLGPSPKPARKEEQISQMVKHLQHIRTMAGVEAIALGSDFDGVEDDMAIANCSETDKLAEALSAAGFTHKEIEKIWYKNGLRVLQEVL